MLGKWIKPFMGHSVIISNLPKIRKDQIKFFNKLNFDYAGVNYLLPTNKKKLIYAVMIQKFRNYSSKITYNILKYTLEYTCSDSHLLYQYKTLRKKSYIVNKIKENSKCYEKDESNI